MAIGHLCPEIFCKLCLVENYQNTYVFFTYISILVSAVTGKKCLFQQTVAMQPLGFFFFLYNKVVCFDGYRNADMQSSPKDLCIYFSFELFMLMCRLHKTSQISCEIYTHKHTNTRIYVYICIACL